VWGNRYQVATTLPLAALQKVPGVQAVLPNNLFVSQDATSTTEPLPETPPGTAMPATGGPYSPYDYYLDKVAQSLAGGAEYATAGDGPNFALAWHRSTGAGVTVAIIDSGVDTTNPDLAGVILPTSRNFMVSPPGTSVMPTGTDGEYHHGTNVAGVIAAQSGNGWGMAGAAPGAKILALQCDDDGSLSDSCVSPDGRTDRSAPSCGHARDGGRWPRRSTSVWTKHLLPRRLPLTTWRGAPRAHRLGHRKHRGALRAFGGPFFSGPSTTA
jgi:subtilisin family serine protease